MRKFRREPVPVNMPVNIIERSIMEETIPRLATAMQSVLADAQVHVRLALFPSIGNLECPGLRPGLRDLTDLTGAASASQESCTRMNITSGDA